MTALYGHLHNQVEESDACFNRVLDSFEQFLTMLEEAPIDEDVKIEAKKVTEREIASFLTSRSKPVSVLSGADNVLRD